MHGNTMAHHTSSLASFQAQWTSNNAYRKPREHSTAHTLFVLFKELRILKLFDIVELKTAMIMYKPNKQLLPLNIQRLFSVDEVTYYNTRQLTNMKQVYFRTTLKSKCISICGVKLWNSLNMDLRNSTTLPRFKKEYKNSLLWNYDLSNWLPSSIVYCEKSRHY